MIKRKGIAKMIRSFQSETSPKEEMILQPSTTISRKATKVNPKFIEAWMSFLGIASLSKSNL
jgi:hypothetical protein